MSRRASRPAGPVTPGTDQLVGTWTRADDAAAPEPLPTGTADPPPARRSGTGGVDPERPDASRADDRSGGTVRARRRVTTQPVPGSDPAPAPEPARHRDGENDARLRGDVPPHWG